MSPSTVFTPGSTAIITGAASGIGLAIAKLCRSKGMNVLMVDNNTEALQKAKLDIVGADAAATDSQVRAVQVDVSQPDAWAALKDQAVAAFGSVEMLFLNAGVGLRGTWGDTEYFQKVRHKAPV